MAFIPLKPIPIKYRHSMIYVGIERIGIRDGTFVVIDNINVERMHIPVGIIACLLLEKGIRISLAAIN